MSSNVEILIVEESLAESEHLKHILEQHEYQVSVVHSRNVALDAARLNPPQIVISGVLLPEMEGERSAIEKAQIANPLSSEELLGFMLESAKDYSIFTTDAEGRVTSWNAGAERFFGYSEAEILGQNGAILFTPEDRDNGRPEQELHTALTKGRAKDERWHLRKDGTRFWVSGMVRPHWDDAGQLHGFIKIGRDLTERKTAQDELRKAHNKLEQRVEKRTAQLKKANEKLQSEINERKRAEQALIESEKHFRRIVETAQEGVWMADEQAKTSYVNDRMAEMLGYTVDEMLGRSIYDFMDDESRIEAERNFQKRRDGIKEQYDFRIRRKDGTDLWAFVSTNPIINDNNVFMGAVGLITDITERKSAVMLLQNNLSLLTSTFEATADGILVVDINNKILTFNEKFVEMWCIPKEAAREKNTAQILACVFEQLKDVESFKKKLEKSLQHPEATDFSILELKDGRFYERFSLPQILEGKVVGRVLSYRDITERKKAEDSIRFQAHLLDTVEQAVIATDLDGVVIYWNWFAQRLYGWSAVEAVGRNIMELTTPEISQEQAVEIMARLSTGQGWAGEFIVQNKNGVTFPAYITNSPLNEKGTLIGIVGVSIDITKRRQAEDDLRQSEANLAAAQRIAHLGSWELDILDLEDANKNPVHCSDEVYRIFGYEPGQIEVTSEVFYSFVRSHERTRISEALSETVKQRKNLNIEFSIVLPDGRESIVHLQAEAIYDEQLNKPSKLIGTIQDITNRKLAEDELRRNLSLLTSTFEATADAILVVDQNFQVVTFNKKFIEMWRIPKEAAREKNTAQILAAFCKQLKDVESFKKKLEETLKNPEVVYFSILELADGRFCECNSFPQTLEGKVVGRVISYRDITERKQAENNLQKEREFLDAVLENISDGIVACDADGVLTLFNRATREIHGLNEESISAEHWATQFDLYLPDGKTMMNKEQIPLFRALHDGAVRDMEMVVAPKNGPVRRLIASGNAIFDDQGKKLGAVVGMHDITERRQAEKSAIEAAQRFRFLAESMPQKMFTALANGDINYANRQWLDFTGLSFKQLEGWSWTQIIHPENFDENVESWKHSIETGEPFEFESRFRRADGEYRWHLNRAHAMRDGNGKVLMWIGTNTDIHEQKLAQEALNIARLQLESALDAGAIATWNYDILNNRVFADKNMVQLYSLSPEDAACGPAENYLHAIHPDDRPQVEEDLAKAISNANKYEINFRVINSDGAIRWIESRGQIERDGNGAAVRMGGVNIDVTMHIEAEENLRLSQERLQQLQKMEAIGTLTGGVAHDFNNLLTVILGNTQLAQRRLAPDDPIQLSLTGIADAGNRAAELTRKLLAFSRRQHLERRIVNLNEIIGEIMMLLERIIGEDVELSVKYGSGLPTVFADPGQIGQVVMNLAVNARDAMPSGGKLTIETSCVELDESYRRKYPYVMPGRYVQIRVSDSGIGMNEEIQTRVFEPYFTTKEVGKGTGLGLSMVYGIISQHDGHVNLYSEPGFGTTFKVYLPVAKKIVEENVPPTLLSSLGGKETILVAEDEEPLRNLAKDTLEELGYTVLLAKNGEEAVEIFSANRERIDLFLSDVVMPKMGGSEAYERIHEMGGNIPLIFMTGYSSETVQSRFVKSEKTVEELGAVVIQKPYSLEQLGRVVREVLDKNHKP